jgi:coatomer subunit beta'
LLLIVVKVYKNFVEKPGGLDIPFQADGLTGGVLLGVKGQGGISFYDWATGGLVRRIEVEPKQVYWSENGELVTLACDDTFYVLRFSRENYIEAAHAGQVDEDGVEAAFEVITDIAERYANHIIVRRRIFSMLTSQQCTHRRMGGRFVHLHQ